MFEDDESEEEERFEGKKKMVAYQELEDISPWELGDTTIATLPTNLLDASFVRQGLAEHAQHGFPLVPPDRVPNKHYTPPLHPLQHSATIEPTSIHPSSERERERE